MGSSTCWQAASQQYTVKLFWAQEDEKRARICNPAEKKSCMHEGLNHE
jgi:hypothetical protein